MWGIPTSHLKAPAQTINSHFIFTFDNAIRREADPTYTHARAHMWARMQAHTLMHMLPVSMFNSPVIKEMNKLGTRKGSKEFRLVSEESLNFQRGTGEMAHWLRTHMLFAEFISQYPLTEGLLMIVTLSPGT